MKIKGIMDNYIFDLDNTLYHPETGMLDEVNERINEFMTEHVGIDKKFVDSLRKNYRDVYGATLLGLMNDYAVFPDDYLSYVHKIKYADYIGKDIKLRNILNGIEGYKAVFTNGSKEHALNVLNILEIDTCFDNVFSIEDTDYVPKPKSDSFKRMIKLSSIEPGESILFEDMEANLHSAAEEGFKTAIVWRENNGFFDYHFPSIYEIECLFREKAV